VDDIRAPETKSEAAFFAGESSGEGAAFRAQGSLVEHWASSFCRSAVLLESCNLRRQLVFARDVRKAHSDPSRDEFRLVVAFGLARVQGTDVFTIYLVIEALILAEVCFDCFINLLDRGDFATCASGTLRTICVSARLQPVCIDMATVALVVHRQVSLQNQAKPSTC
jgi:hypothetical protein